MERATLKGYVAALIIEVLFFMVIACIIFTALLSTSVLENTKWQVYAAGILLGEYML